MKRGQRPMIEGTRPWHRKLQIYWHTTTKNTNWCNKLVNVYSWHLNSILFTIFTRGEKRVSDFINSWWSYKTRITFWLRFKCVLLKQFRPCMTELSNKHKNPLDYTEMGLKSVSRRMTVTCGFNRRKRDHLPYENRRTRTNIWNPRTTVNIEFVFCFCFPGNAHMICFILNRCRDCNGILKNLASSKFKPELCVNRGLEENNTEKRWIRRRKKNRKRHSLMVSVCGIQGRFAYFFFAYFFQLLTHCFQIHFSNR